MKLLFDENLSSRLGDQLVDLFPGSSQVRLAGLARSSDRDVWAFAKSNGFAIVSLDADFAEMAALLGAPPKVVWLRCGNQPSVIIENLLRQNAAAIKAFEHDTADCLEIYLRD